MDASFYTTTHQDAFLLVDESAAARDVYTLQCGASSGAVRVIRGWKCTTYESLHSEIGAALQFPEYYGENWDALDECLTDLAWLPAEWYLLHLRRVEKVLQKDTDGLRTLIRILRDASLEWADPRRQGWTVNENQVAVPFHTVISGTAAGLERARTVIASISINGAKLPVAAEPAQRSGPTPSRPSRGPAEPGVRRFLDLRR